MFEYKLSESDDLPTLIQLDIHEIAVEEILGDGFLHERLQGTYLVFLWVEIKLFEPRVYKLRKASKPLLRIKEKELIDLRVHNCPEDLDEYAWEGSAALDSTSVDIVCHTLLNKWKEGGSKVIHVDKVDLLMLAVLQVLLLQTHRLNLVSIFLALDGHLVLLQLGFEVDCLDGLEEVHFILEVRVRLELL